MTGALVTVAGLAMLGVGLWLFGFTVGAAAGVPLMLAGLAVAWMGVHVDWERGDGESGRAGT